MLEDKVFQELEKAVGSQNISREPAILDTYAFQWAAEILNVLNEKPPSRYYIRPAAVILPNSTPQVQEIVKTCNKYKIKFKAFSTGLGPWNCVSDPQSIHVDLRRMNKIIQIDAKNLYAVVEPYVSGAQLQSEAMKHGLNCGMPGAGPQVSPLASATSMCGMGFTSAATGFAGRSVLGVEWVLPSGELLQIGALGLKENSDWFTGDGPGPSLRGIMRGFVGAKSGLGIFTKVAVKLYPFPSKPEWKVSGESPDYEFEIPNYMKLSIINYRNWDALANALRRFEEEELGYMCYHLSASATLAGFAKTREELANQMAIQARLKRPITILIAAQSEREFIYKQKVLEGLIEETGGQDYTKKLKIRNISYAEGLRCMFGFHGFLITGAFQSTHGCMDTIDNSIRMGQLNTPLKKEFIDKKVIVDDQGDGLWLATFEHGHMSHLECPTMYSATDATSIKGMVEYIHASDKLDLDEHLGIPFFIIGDKQHEWYGPQCMNYHIWLRKIKEAFDPNNTADPGFYISSKK
ncbi:MAG TPA: FAD-binding oxidoreductase [Candidatus Deferrimicrobium sp.]|nr:FAD-binding oxidoreductase [Candidatus Deferrimicrobium sp.]